MLATRTLHTHREKTTRCTYWLWDSNYSLSFCMVLHHGLLLVDLPKVIIVFGLAIVTRAAKGIYLGLEVKHLVQFENCAKRHTLKGQKPKIAID
jgi:hypothetical protein